MALTPLLQAKMIPGTTLKISRQPSIKVDLLQAGEKQKQKSHGASFGDNWKGTYVYTKGTGKYEGVKGSGTWDSYSLAPMQSHLEVEGEIELP